jgi:transcriptional regulator with XRE-family HTH domain
MYAAQPLEKLPPPERRKARRVAAGVTVEDAATAMGIDAARLEQWETVDPEVGPRRLSGSDE